MESFHIQYCDYVCHFVYEMKKPRSTTTVGTQDIGTGTESGFSIHTAPQYIRVQTLPDLRNNYVPLSPVQFGIKYTSGQWYDLKEKRGYWKLKKETLDRSLWRTRFGRGYGPVVRQTTE
jgi:hypothetical protein